MSEERMIAGKIKPQCPRMPSKDEDLVGKVCVCSTGRPAVVTHQGFLEVERGDGTAVISAWMGLGLDGKGTWASTRPCIIAESGAEFHDRLFDRFGGKTPFSG